MLRRTHRQIGLAVAVVVFPLLPGTGGYLGSAAQAAVFTIVAASLVLLTGWIGQISLAQAAFVGIGAYATGWAGTDLGLMFPLSLPVAALVAGGAAALLGVVALRVRGLYLAVATLIFSWAASEYLFRQSWVLENGTVPEQAIGAQGSLLHFDIDSRFTYYYVAWAVTIAILFALVNLRDAKTGRAFYAVRGSEMAAASLGMDVLRYKTLAFALSGAIAGIAGNLTMSHARVVSADAFDFTRSLFYLAIAVVGGLNSLAGAVAAGLLFAIISELFWRVTFLNEFLELTSAVLLAVIFRAYPGGLAAIGGRLARSAAAVASWWRKLPERLARLGETPAPEPVTDTETMELPADEVRRGRVLSRLRGSGVGLRRIAVRLRTVTITGVGRVVRSLRPSRDAAGEGILDFIGTGPSAGAPAPSSPPATSSNGHTQADAESSGDLMSAAMSTSTSPDGAAYDPSQRDSRRALVEAEHITVRFGGLVAVNDASLKVPEGEITALIGPNGAGKTTLFNSIAGFNEPTEGAVKLYGRDVTSLAVHRRARLGVARTFQLIQLFPELTVFDNLLAATHMQNPTGFIEHMAVTPSAMHAEMAARDRVKRVVELLDLQDVADRPVAGLPFGVLRMIEVARSLVIGARVIMLDEPASGLDERETDVLMEVLRLVRSLGATLLLIEHDVRMVTAVSDYIYVLDRGTIIAAGTPEAIQRDPDVIAAYLGAPPEPEPDAPHGPPEAHLEPSAAVATSAHEDTIEIAEVR